MGGGGGGYSDILHTHRLGQFLGVLNFESQYLWEGDQKK